MTTTDDDGWLRRYGSAAPARPLPRNEVLELLYRHRSVRRFGPGEVDDATVTAIVAAAQSASTSSNLQAWSVVEVRDPARLDTLAHLAGDQDFIRRGAVFLVFVADWARASELARRVGEPAEAVDYIESTIVGFVDAALAAQNAVIAAESLGLGAVYVGSVRNNPEQIADVLELPPGAFPAFGVVIGHPDPDDPAGVKPRLPQTVVRHRERYRLPEADEIAVYDAAVTAYYATQGEPRGWLRAAIARVRDAASLHGRHTMRASLERRGLPSR
ncbi:nitroreductase family protein [Microbacterium oleivorans]|uniref:nitroreductase family protein n=1 Tax=Microbacterium oleivorans TaxID=273677 RepID=UPI001C4A74BC|nr:nitroreductase family protein [Microbacterium oleivorans]